MTDIAKLGEFGLIKHLTKDVKLKNASSLKGVGDDCAVLSYPEPGTRNHRHVDGGHSF